ncbi:leishmanolysin-like peptidase isoform X7 [Ictidomys tridecemlineatus]
MILIDTVLVNVHHIQSVDQLLCLRNISSNVGFAEGVNGPVEQWVCWIKRVSEMQTLSFMLVLWLLRDAAMKTSSLMQPIVSRKQKWTDEVNKIHMCTHLMEFTDFRRRQPQEFIGMLSTVKHEIIHALGFSAGLFAFYHDKDGNPLTSRFADGLPPFNYSLGLYQWSDKVVRKVERSWNIRDNKIVRHTVYLLVTPRVVDEARKHFNCPILEGMELENQGGMGTELNHWEKRLLENEAMTGSHTQNRVLSRITLALMEDTGWYKANYSMAEKLDWGRGMGCDFVRKSCKFWIDQQRQKRQVLSPYCDTLRSNPLQLTCRQDQRAVAVCNLQKFPKPLPPEYQYFDELSGIPTEDLPYYGGSVEIADYCPFSQEFSWHLSGEYQRSSDCRILENQPEIFKNYGAEKYGPHSVCLIQKSAFVMEKCERKLSYPDWGSGCYQISCSLQGLTVWVQDTSYLCSRAGQVLPVSIQMNGWIHEGNLLCPSCWDFCEQCPPETDPPVANLTRALPLVLLSVWHVFPEPTTTVNIFKADDWTLELWVSVQLSLSMSVFIILFANSNSS